MTGQSMGYELSTAAFMLGTCTVAMYAIQVLNMIFRQNLNNVFGIAPRNIFGLPGIVTAPLFHGNWSHLVANTLPFLVLGGTVFVSAPFGFVTTVSWLASGVLVWLIGARGRTVGMSGVIFGYFGFLVTRGILGGTGRDILIAVAVVVVYGSLAWGVLPRFRSNVSWQAHLGGALGGGFAAYLLHTSAVTATSLF